MKKDYSTWTDTRPTGPNLASSCGSRTQFPCNTLNPAHRALLNFACNALLNPALKEPKYTRPFEGNPTADVAHDEKEFDTPGSWDFHLCWTVNNFLSFLFTQRWVEGESCR